MSRAISNFYANVGFNVDRRSLATADRALKTFERHIQSTMSRLQRHISGLSIGSVKVKRLTLDELAAQRNLQMALNRIGRLLELKVGNVRLDEQKINSQVSKVMTRASSKARMDIKSVLGTHGGSNIHWPGMPNAAALSQYASSQGFGGGSFGMGLPMMGGPLGMAAGAAIGAVAGGAYYAYDKTKELKRSQTEVEAQRVKLDVASGYKDRKDIDRQNEEFFSLANMTGSDAMSLVDSYSQMMKTLQAIGLSSEKSFDLYKNMSLFAKSTGADSQQMSRAGYAIGQIYGKGFVSREELQLQLADALPSFKRYLMDVYAKETGNSSFESFDKALTDKKITTQMLEQAFREAAKSGMPNVQQYANTAQGMENQYANQVLQEQMRRTLDDEMVPAAKRFTQAQGELYKATAPLRNAMYDLSAGALSATASLVSWGAKLTTDFNQSPAMQKQASYEQRSEAVMASSTGRGLLSVPTITRLQEQPRKLTTPQLYQKPEWQMQAAQYANPESILEQLSSTTNHIRMDASMTISAGGIVVNTQAKDAEQLAQELEPHIRQQFDNSLQGLLTETDLAFGSK